MINFEEEKAITIELGNEETIQTEVQDINYIPAYKKAEEERRTNELQRIANENERITNETERETYYNDFTSKVNSGYFDGVSGVYIGSEPPTDEDINVWIDPNGNPEVEAKNIVFSDNENLQTKYENGELKGDKGDKGADGTMSFEDLTEEQKASLKGDKGDKGDTGEQGVAGKDGTDGYTPVKGVDYFTEEDINSLNNTLDFVKTSDYEAKVSELETNIASKFDSSKIIVLSKTGTLGTEVDDEGNYSGTVTFDNPDGFKVTTISRYIILSKYVYTGTSNNNIDQRGYTSDKKIETYITGGSITSGAQIKATCYGNTANKEFTAYVVLMKIS